MKLETIARPPKRKIALAALIVGLLLGYAGVVDFWFALSDTAGTLLIASGTVLGLLGGLAVLAALIPAHTWLRVKSKAKDYAATVLIASLILFLYFGLDSCDAVAARSRDADRQRTIVHDVLALVDACKSRGRGSVEIRGRALVWDTVRDKGDDANYRLPDDLKYSSANFFRTLPDGPVTVFMVTRDPVQVGTYSNGARAYRDRMDVAVVYWPEKRPVGMTTLDSLDPPSTIKEVWGHPIDVWGDTSRPLAEWIAGLRRIR